MAPHFMRHILVVFLVWGIANARFAQPEVMEDDDDINNGDVSEFSDPDTEDDSEQSDDGVPTGPSAPDAVSLTSQSLSKFGKQMDSPVASTGPATVSMAASLETFGKQDHSVAPALASAAAPEPAPAKKPEIAPAQQAAAQAEADAQNAHVAAATAKSAAEVANKVAVHSVHIAEHATSALKSAHDALHQARVDSSGLSHGQKQSLKAAEAKLREATKKAEYGQVKNAKYVKAEVENKALQNMENRMDKVKKNKLLKKESEDDELDALQKEIKELRKQLREKEGDKAEDDATVKELQDELEELKAAEKRSDKGDKNSHDELKAETERLRAQIKNMKGNTGHVTYKIPGRHKEVQEEEVARHSMPHNKVEETKVKRYQIKMKPLSESEEKRTQVKHHVQVSHHHHDETTPVEEKGIDIDTAMPYGDLEPFGREDTAQELTENSVRESDQMVDQLERAEVAEEKRSVFRALTRLRGAAITSFDGVARSQTGNIDQYNKVHKWRKNHPMHHLADEESDIQRWAFPDTAD